MTAAEHWPDCLSIRAGDCQTSKPILVPCRRWPRHLAGVAAAAVLLHLTSFFLLVLLALPAVREQRRDPPHIIAVLLYDDNPATQPITPAPPQPEETPKQLETTLPVEHPVTVAPAPMKEPPAEAPPEATPPQRLKPQAISVRPAPAPPPQKKPQQFAPPLAAPATTEPAVDLPASSDAIAADNDAPPAGPPQPPSLLPREETASPAPSFISNDFHNIREAIVAALIFPPRARKMGISGGLIVSFDLLADGSVGDILVTTSSGYQLLDDSVVATIRRLAPFPAPIRPGRLELPIRFNLR